MRVSFRESGRAETSREIGIVECTRIELRGRRPSANGKGQCQLLRVGLAGIRFSAGGFGCGCRRGDRNGDGGQRIDTIGAEAVTAVETLQIFEETIIDGGTDTGTRQAAGSAADQATDQGAGKAADTATDGAGESTEGETDLGAGDGTGGTACCPADRADEGAGLLGQVFGDDALGTADWAIEAHGKLLGKVETTTKIRQRCLTGGMAGGWVGREWSWRTNWLPC